MFHLFAHLIFMTISMLFISTIYYLAVSMIKVTIGTYFLKPSGYQVPVYLKLYTPGSHPLPILGDANAPLYARIRRYWVQQKKNPS